MRAIRFKFHASARARWKQIRTLAADEVLQMSLFDKRDLAEVSHPDFPGERLVVCRNPLLAEERERKREELIAAAEQKFETVRAATRRQKRRWRDRDKINYRLGRVLASSKVAKYFRWDITAEGLEYERNQQAIERDEVLDGVYVIRTSLSQEKLKATEAVRAYKRLAQVERAFRSLQSVDLHLRPIYHRLPDRVRAHVLLCLLAYHVEWHMRQALAPLLFDDEQRGEEPSSPVAPAERSAAARAKARRKRTPEGNSKGSGRPTILLRTTIPRVFITTAISTASMGGKNMARVCAASSLTQARFNGVKTTLGRGRSRERAIAFLSFARMGNC